MAPKVSIVVPVYGVEAYIEKCIDSLRNQTEKNIEIILIDDGTKDLSGEICDNYAAIDNRIVTIHTENNGVSCARNTGMKASSGEWICFVDGDDYAKNNMIETLLEYSDGGRYDVVIGDYYVDDGKSKAEYFFDREREYCSHDKAEIIRAAVIGNNNIHTTVGTPWGKLYSRAFLTGNDLWFRPGLKRMQDMVFNLYVFNKAQSIRYIHQPVYYYSIRKGSAVHGYDPLFGDSFERIITELDEFGRKEYSLNDWKSIADAKKIGLFIEWCKLFPCNRKCNLGLIQKIDLIRVKFEDVCAGGNTDKTFFSNNQIVINLLSSMGAFPLVFFLLFLDNHF